MTIYLITILLFCTYVGAEPSPENASLDEKTLAYPSKTTDALHVQQAMMSLQLYKAQIDVAHNLETAYLEVADHHPEVAKALRLTAHKARTQHLMTSGLMQNFMVTAGHIVKTIVPLIKDAVEDKDKDIIYKFLEQIIELAKDMKNDATNAKQSYYEIQTLVQDNLALITTKNKEIIDEAKRTKIEMLSIKKTDAEIKLDVQYIEDDLKEIEDQLESLKAGRDRVEGEMGGKAHDHGGHSAISIRSPEIILVDVIWHILQKGINLFSYLLGQNNQEQQSDAYKTIQDSLDKALNVKRDLRSRLQERRKAKLEGEQKLQELEELTESELNIDGLEEAGEVLGDVDKQFTQILLFWGRMVDMLKSLQSDTKAGKAFLDKIEDTKYADKFKSQLDISEKAWKAFLRICSNYVETSETDAHIGISKLYNFLSSAPIAKRRRKDEL